MLSSNGVLFEIWTEMGYGHKERFYQKAVANGFKTLI